MTLTVVEAGRQGGLKVLRTHGRDFFIRIGRKGQGAMRAKYPDMAKQWGKLGGRPKKLTLNQIMGEKGK
jgi:general stress protein YciG